MDNNSNLEISKPSILIVIVGLPGSGKSTYIKELKKQHPDSLCYDDYQGDAYGNNSDPRLSKHYGPLVSGLKAGKTVIVSDIRYCLPGELGSFLGAILSAAPNVNLEFKYFANDPEICRKNVIDRAREERDEKELELIDTLGKFYKVPTVERLPVYLSSHD